MESYDDLIESVGHGSFVVRERCRCGKARYRSEAQAKRAIRSMVAHRKEREGQGHLVAYFCRLSRSWHNGHIEE